MLKSSKEATAMCPATPIPLESQQASSVPIAAQGQDPCASGWRSPSLPTAKT